MKLAIFDLDNTLLGGDSDHAWGEFLIDEGLVDAETHRARNDAFYRQYQDGTLKIADYVAFAAEPIAGLNPEHLNTLHDAFMERFIHPLRLPKAMELLDSHRQSGDKCLIITATNRFITDPIARWLGVEELIATELETVDGIYTGKMLGTPCFQQGKVTRLREWLESHHRQSGAEMLTLDNSVFYSDSFNDLPLLEQAGEAVAVDPDDRLRDIATRRGWRVLSLR
ncbi:MAG: HAD family hydrolase [Pseudohongiellaceae bacterium]